MQARPEHQETPAGKTLVIVGIIALAFNLRPAAVSVGPVLQEIIRDMHMSATVAGLLTAMPVIAFSSFGALAPGLARRMGAHRLTLVALVLVVLGYYRIDGLNPWAYLLPALAMALTAGVIEELLFRGVLFRVIEESLGSWVAMVVSSAVFGASHLFNPQATLVGALAISVEAGLMLAAAFMVTRRLWLAMGVHMAWNYTQSAVFSGVVSGGVSTPGLVRITIDGPDLLTGGSFGLEASGVAFVLCTTAGPALLLRLSVMPAVASGG